MTPTFEARRALGIAGALSVTCLACIVGCASRALMNPAPASLPLSGASVMSSQSAADGGAVRPESEKKRDRGILGDDPAPARSGEP